jgi:hypothetical protein
MHFADKPKGQITHAVDEHGAGGSLVLGVENGARSARVRREGAVHLDVLQVGDVRYRTGSTGSTTMK